MMKVSVIIPCYNVEMYIADCLHSVEQQQYPDIEVICVDDGSTDQTVAKIKDHIAASRLSIRLIEQENGGAPKARNAGVAASTGTYLQFLDADDMLEPDKIEHQVNIAATSNLPNMIIGSWRKENMQGKCINERSYTPKVCDNLWKSLMKTDLGNTCSNLFKRDLFENGIAWNEKMKSSQEYDLMFQILKTTDNIVIDSEIGTIVRQRDFGSISQVNLDGKWERYVQLRCDIVNHMKATKQVMTDDMYQVLFDSIRMLSPYNMRKAISIFKNYIPKNFKPSQSPATGKTYLLMYNILGFANTERLRSRLTRLKAA